MEIESCLNLCDILQQADLTNTYKRLYIGSYFCGQYFIRLSVKQMEKLASYAAQEKIKVTLVIPLVTEKYLQKAKDKIKEMMTLFGSSIDEVTINDFAMLGYVYQTYGSGNPEGKLQKLNIGRLMMKDYRDPRFKDYFNEPFKPRSFTNYFNSLLKQYAVYGVEFDPTHAVLDLSDCPSGVQVQLHRPYCYETVGQICQMAGVGKPIEKKFKPNDDCAGACVTHPMTYFSEEGQSWVKHGRAVFFNNADCQVTGVSAMREIFWPLEEEEQA